MAGTPGVSEPVTENTRSDWSGRAGFLLATVGGAIGSSSGRSNTSSDGVTDGSAPLPGRIVASDTCRVAAPSVVVAGGGGAVVEGGGAVVGGGGGGGDAVAGITPG